MLRNKKANLLTMLFSTPLIAIAQTGTTKVQTQNVFWYNPMVLFLVALIIILLFGIGVMANVIKALAGAIREKIRAEKNNANTVKTVLLFLGLFIYSSQVRAAETIAATSTTAPVGPQLIGGIAKEDFYLLVSIILFEALVLIWLTFIVQKLLRALRNAPSVPVAAKVKPRFKFWDRFNSSVAVEREVDVMLDHDYDGIKELDNDLPPWWKYGFYITIVFAAIYLYRYEIAHTTPGTRQEYEAEVQKAKEEQAAYLANAASNVDENNVTFLKDEASLNAAKATFESTCAACHLKDGGGIVGPNLTDDYWLHGGSIKDIFKSIKYGWQDKGMKSWKDDFSPKQIQELASYVKSLHGTHPATPKEKQGELYIEAGPQQPAPDSAGKKITMK